jgi:hypothetical protein
VLAFAVVQWLAFATAPLKRRAKAKSMADTLPENTNAFDPAAPQSATKRRPNAPLWIGFLLSVFAFLSYIPIFAKYPITRDMPWANFLIFALALVFLFLGLRRAFRQPAVYRGKIAGPILTTLSVAALVFFCFTIFSLGKHLPLSTQTPRVGQKAPEFALADTDGAMVSLASLLSTPDAAHPTKGVLLVFYRGYW